MEVTQRNVKIPMANCINFESMSPCCSAAYHVALRVFLQDRRGGVAPMFALAIIPVIGLVGAAIDYSRANSIKAGMQAALDATALAMAKLAPTLTQSRAADARRPPISRRCSTTPTRRTSSITPTYTTSGGSQLTVTASASMDTTFMKVMGYHEPQHRQHVDGEMGQQPPARRAGARQHRLDGERRQDGRAEDGREEPARPSSRTPRRPTATSMCRSFRSART